MSLSAAFSSAASWDPLGVANDAPASLTEKLRAELRTLRQGVRSVVEGQQGLAAVKRGDDSAALVASLQECMQEQRDEVYDKQRELSSLQQTVAMLQDDRRKLQSPPPAGRAKSVEGLPPTQDAGDEAELPPEAGFTAEEMTSAVDAAVAGAREDERARAVEALAAARADHSQRLAGLVREERANAQMDAEQHVRAAAAASNAELAATQTTLCGSLGELEACVDALCEAHANTLQQTKQRAAQMLARKEAEVCARAHVCARGAKGGREEPTEGDKSEGGQAGAGAGAGKGWGLGEGKEEE